MCSSRELISIDGGGVRDGRDGPKTLSVIMQEYFKRDFERNKQNIEIIV